MKNLIPFHSTNRTSQFSIEADCFQTKPTTLTIEFKITGPLEHIVWPSPGVIESREDGLWQSTCLEVFVSETRDKNEPYLEINCSPNGNWNAYSFSNYREGMKSSSDITVRLKERSSEKNEAFFRIEVNSSQPLNPRIVGLTAVVEFLGGEKSYWSLRHAASQPDFHDKNGWE
ncbi:hypothetical protein [Bdellovibrio sp. HCB-162]|uniref:hypothetical protein n=1 Tax=Bdellovibrio sp. HCB-162 TaxID=3394234 RepID=UPI0039BCFF0C